MIVKVNWKNKQAGTALITVVLIAAVVVVMVVESIKVIKFQKQLSSNLINRDQAYAYLMGMEELAKIYLKKGFDTSDKEIVHLGQPWAQEDILFPIDGGQMTASITDMQSCFNLNSIMAEGKNNQQAAPQSEKPNNDNDGLVNVTQQNSLTDNGLSADNLPNLDTLEELIEKTKPNSEVIGKDLASATKDWIDDDFIETGAAGAEDPYYQGLEIPYRAANNLLAHKSELLTIRGFNHKLYSALKPLVCVLPSKDIYQINVNTVKEENAKLLSSVINSSKVTESDISKALSERPEEGFETVADFFDAMDLQDAKELKSDQLTVTSAYFEMKAIAEIGKTRVQMKTLFERDAESNFKVVSRYYGRD